MAFHGITPIAMQDRPSQEPQNSANCDGIVADIQLTRPVVLIGMMGAGKTHIGRLLASATGYPFIDSDAVIEEAIGCTIASYFASHGENAFREREYEALEKLLSRAPAIIGAGGGAVTYPKTMELLKTSSVPVWLEASPEILAARCAGSNARPLLNNGDPKTILENLLGKRGSLYESAAAVKVRSDIGQDKDVVARIIEKLKVLKA